MVAITVDVVCHPQTIGTPETLRRLSDSVEDQAVLASLAPVLEPLRACRDLLRARFVLDPKLFTTPAHPPRISRIALAYPHSGLVIMRSSYKSLYFLSACPCGGALGGSTQMATIVAGDPIECERCGREARRWRGEALGSMIRFYQGTIVSVPSELAELDDLVYQELDFSLGPLRATLAHADLRRALLALYDLVGEDLR